MSLFYLLYHATIFAQNCGVPFNIKFENKQTTSVEISWSDLNNAPLGWEFEIVIKGQSRTGVPSLPMTSQKNIQLVDLKPSTAYELYIRTVCTNDLRSNWNVAIPFTTMVEIPSACKINIPLKDNGTDMILLDVRETGILGKNLFLQSVDLIIEHDWPADLKISLESPQGQQLLLSDHNGTGTDDFGDVQDEQCTLFTSFAPNACADLKSSKPPYIGTYRPDGDINFWRQDTLSKGIWKLIIYDRAFKDAGILKYINLNFSKEDCVVPTNFTISNTDIDSITVKWDYMSPSPCSSVDIGIIENGIVLPSRVVECDLGSYTFKDLLPNTEYEFTIASNCSLSSISPKSCPIIGFTSCEPISNVENFDKYETCKEGCSSSCRWPGSIWFNVSEDSGQDWILWRGKTDTEHTGPNSDISETGQYIYIENNPQLCGTANEVILQSVCMDVKSNPSGCDMSFYYHMYGADIKYLMLEISTDDGVSWETLFSVYGNQGDTWKRSTLDLSIYNNQSGIFRFKALSSEGTLGDIGIDQIEFYKSIPLKDGSDVYFVDKDMDGYGNEAERIEICFSILPDGYSKVYGDCDDENPTIHPNATEIQCNNIDENCNGLEDDQSEFNPIHILSSITHTTCNGSNDGQIDLTISGGTAPYHIIWNNNGLGSHITNLSTGIYYATITDAGGCVVTTDYYQINTLTNLNVIVTEMNQASCKGKSDAFVVIAHNAEHPPYTYKWSDGTTDRNLVNVPDGIYSVTVADANQCLAFLKNIVVTAKPSILVDVKNITHPFCFSQNTGSIELFTIKGTPPYNYEWDSGQTSNKIVQLVAGNYTCTVTDSNGCFSEFNTTVVEPKGIDIKVLSTESVRCFGEFNGSIKTNVTGGTSPYTYLWNKLSERTDDIFNLEAGNYILTVTDANGCKKVSQPIDVLEPELFTILIDSVAPASCLLGQNGYIKLSIVGGNGGERYVWNHTQASEFEFNNLMSGNYDVTAYDVAGCKASIPNIMIPFVNISIPIELELINDNLCYKDSKAKISSTISYGQPRYDYNWSHGLQYFNPSDQDTIENLPAGKYQLSITDADGCFGFSNVVNIEEKAPFYYNIQSIKDNICQDDSAGFISLNINGGALPLGISWNGGLYAGPEIKHLPNGIYQAQIVDKQNCTLAVLPITIHSESDIFLYPDITPDKNNNSLGKICINPVGGQLPYNIRWSNGTTDLLCIQNLPKGRYHVTITDGLGCIKEETFLIEDVSALKDEYPNIIGIYPNPASEYLNIQSNSPLKEIKLININGKYLKSFYNVHGQIPIQDLIDGIYLLLVRTEQAYLVFKFVKV
ncbi:MAG: T9SS type A sorting domain-containing protein [Saprospiraceae bacterium]|nr:T9SS type A sorting domain-containing protein [Saprospiraceae bacterium]